MSADHTITTKNRTEEISETTQKLLHDYFERSGSASLINRLAPDVLWFSEEESGGKEEAARYLTAWKEGFFNSYVESESYEAKNLGEGYSLCIANLALLVHPGKTFTLHQTRKLTFIFRRLRDKNTDESTWEIIHLAVATLAPKTAPGKLPEISCSLDNLRYLNRFTTGDLSLDETRSLYALLQEKVFRHFTQEKKDMLTALSLFDVFTLSQAKYMYPSGDTTAMMREEEESGLFLYLVKGTTGSYRFFPVMRQFLAAEFSARDPKWQSRCYLKAARWHYAAGNYLEAMQAADKGDDYDMALNILAGGSDSILFSGRRTYRRSLVKRCPRNVVKRHIHTICLMVYDLYYSGMKDEFRTQYARLREIDAGVSERAAVHFLGTMTNFNNLDPMITGAKEALDTIRRYNLWKEFKTPHLGFCCPTLLLLYHSTPGQLLTEVEKLAELQSTLERIGRHEYGSAWSHLFHAEYYLLTGDWEKGLGELSALEASPGYANPSVKIRSAYLRGWLAFVTGRASSIREIETEMHGYLASTAEYQTLIASLSECGFHLMFGTDSNIKKEYKRILDPQRFYFPSHTYIEIMKDRILLRDGKDTDLLAEAETHETHARQRKSVIGMIFALLNQAAAYKRLGEEENSLQALEETLTLAGPDHLILPFILFSDELKDLWKKVRAPRHSASIVETMSQYTRPTSPEIPSLEEMRRDQIKKLTGREMEIIHLAVQGLKNKEIAEEQKVAEITIKKAMSTIYRKLNISGRPELLTIFGEEKHEEE